jgi:rhodanese-related sulfurtransferase
MAKSAADLVAAARARVENLRPEAVESELTSCGAILVDIRESDEFETQGRIFGALHIPRGLLEFRADPTLPSHQPPLHPSARVILHCTSGLRSALAAVSLMELGYDRVAHLDGGIDAWKAAGRPVV